MNSTNSTDDLLPSLWAATAIPGAVSPPLNSDTRAEVGIVGGGYTGLSAALHLAEAGREVVLLEAGEPGWGCSGRNGGQVNPALNYILPHNFEKAFGSVAGRRFAHMAHGSCDLVFDLVTRLGIECEAVRPGYVQGATSRHGAQKLADWAAAWAPYGAGIELLEGAEVTRLLGTGRYGWALHDSRGGNLQPLSYARGLACAATVAGARIHGQSRVTSIVQDIGPQDKRRWRLTSNGGDLLVDHVLLCTNGYSDDLWPGLRETVVPVASFAAATEPLSANLSEAILPGRHAVSEARWLPVYYRKDVAGRFIIGGRGNIFNSDLSGPNHHLHEAAQRLFPALEDVQWEYHWGGYVAMTLDKLPRLIRLAEGVHAGLGFNGRGVAMATVMGRELAKVVQGMSSDIPVKPLARIPLHRLRQVGIATRILYGRIRDRLEEARWSGTQ